MFLQGHFLPLGLGQDHSDHPLGLEATEATSGLDYTSAGDVAFSCLSLVALNSSGHLEPEQAVVGKDTGPRLAAQREQGRQGCSARWGAGSCL